MNKQKRMWMQAKIAPVINSDDCNVQWDFIIRHGQHLSWQKYFDWLLNYAQMHRYSINDEHWLVGTIEKPYPRITSGSKSDRRDAANAFYAINLQSSEYELYPADLDGINGVLIGEFLERVEGAEVFGKPSKYTIEHYGDFERII